VILFLLIAMIVILRNSFWPTPLSISLVTENNRIYILSRHNVKLKDINVYVYDKDGNFMCNWSAYKEENSNGSSKLYLFEKNLGYMNHMNCHDIHNEFFYKIYVESIGYKDSLIWYHP